MIRSLTLAFLLLPCAAMAQDPGARYGQWIHLMHDQKYEEAVAFAFQWEKAGDGWARTRVEEWYGGGGDPEDSPPPVQRLVAQHLDRAAQAGDARAQFALGYRALKGERLDEAVGWLEKSADQGNKESIYILGSMSPQALAERGIKSKHAGKFLEKGAR